MIKHSTSNIMKSSETNLLIKNEEKIKIKNKIIYLVIIVNINFFYSTSERKQRKFTK